MIQNFFIKDFKGFEEITVPLNNLTVLAGCNSVGKSTIIQALLLSRFIFETRKNKGEGLDRLPVPLKGPFLLDLGNTHEVVRRGKKISESFISFRLSEDINTFFEIGLEGDRTTPNVYELKTTADKFYNLGSGLEHDKFYYLCAERIGPRLKYEFQVLPYPHAGYRGENTLQILSGVNLEIDKSRTQGDNQPALLFDQTRNWLDYITPGATFDNAQVLGKTGVIEGTFGDSLPTNVGFGISYVLPIIVNGLIAEKGSMLIVENPEAHLHPSSQSRIGRFLAMVASTGVQVIVETHSEHVINGIRIATLDKIIGSNQTIINFLAQSDKGCQPLLDAINLNTNADLEKWPKGFFDQQQNDITKIFELRRANKNDKL